jgi:hypothetical protein
MPILLTWKPRAGSWNRQLLLEGFLDTILARGDSELTRIARDCDEARRGGWGDPISFLILNIVDWRCCGRAGSVARALATLSAGAAPTPYTR